MVRNGRITTSNVPSVGTEVIGVETAGGLVPLVFQKRLTPVALMDGENRVHLNASSAMMWLPVWQYVDIDTRAGVVTLIRSQAFPPVGGLR